MESRLKASETRARVTRFVWHGVIIKRARVSLALLSLRENGGLLGVYYMYECCGLIARQCSLTTEKIDKKKLQQRCFFFNQWHRQFRRKNAIVIERVRENQALKKEASSFPQYSGAPNDNFRKISVRKTI